MPFVCLALAGAAAGCGDDDSGNEISPGELSERLVPASDVELESEREFEWDNPTDFVVEGLWFSEATAPSELIGAVEDAGFAAAAGQGLVDESGQTRVSVVVAAFDSEEGALSARDTLHEENLKQPCFAACVVTPVDYEVEGIPDSVAVHQAPNPGKPPPGLFKFESYLVEFTIGDELYAVQADGTPGGIPEEEFDRGAQAVYEYAAANG